MALVREPTLYESFDPEAFVFDGLGYHDPLLDDGNVTNAVALLRTYSDPADNAFAADNHWTAANAGASVLAFDRPAPGHGHECEECDSWIDAMDQSLVAASVPYHTTAVFDAAADCFSLTDKAGSSNDAGRFGLLYHPSTSSPDAARASQKRPCVGAELQTSPKKQCGASKKSTKTKAKSAPTTPTKDPQSLAAKNRRERISERLKILQELVPNGTKVDLVTMLEKAISYVKFLQLQVRVLATDEFWPAQGGKAPEISQVKEALDAIL